MKIAQIAPLFYSIPPKKYGGTERVISVLTEELVKMGHDVTLFASGDSITKAKLRSVIEKEAAKIKTEDLFGVDIYNILNIGEVFKRAEEFDIIHSHVNIYSLPAAELSKTPVVTTFHEPLYKERVKIYRRLKKTHVVAISKFQTKQMKGFNLSGVVYNGLNMHAFPFSNIHKGYLLYVGRICREKGTHIAVRIAKELNLPLIIAAQLHNSQKNYFQKEVKPFLNNKIRWIGEVNETQRNKLYSKALCFLHPLIWDEPFGLTLIEAQACGCPVVAFNKGSMSEIIQNGKTGYVVESIGEMKNAIKKISSINRMACRDLVINKFSGPAMAKGYEQIYKNILLAS